MTDGALHLLRVGLTILIVAVPIHGVCWYLDQPGTEFHKHKVVVEFGAWSGFGITVGYLLVAITLTWGWPR